MFGTLGWQELLIVLVILALVFGASRVSDLGGALGKGIREFRKEARGDEETRTPPATRGAFLVPAIARRPLACLWPAPGVSVGGRLL
jgi:sec-independent protein translocase protein TatA